MKRATFEGLPLEDAKLPFRIPILQVDLDKANKDLKDVGVDDPRRFRECVIAQACRRTCGDEMIVHIMRKTAYVAAPGDGVSYRYELKKADRAVVEEFDRTRKVATGKFITLRPPCPSRTLKKMRKYAKTFAAHHPGYRPLTPRRQRRPDPLAGVVRNGHYVKL